MKYPIDKFQSLRTPFYYYDTELLDETLQAVKAQLQPNWHMHYAVKANTNPKVLRHIVEAGFGADCVSGGEIQACLDAGFPANKIVFAGVGKSDWEIELGLMAGIFCFNVESVPELEVINELAQQHGKIAPVALRINPNVGAHTHDNISTGRAEDKFGIAWESAYDVIEHCKQLSHIECIGLHFHIGSQILEMDDFATLALRINELQEMLETYGIHLQNINVGGGLGIDYEDPDGHPIADFKSYFETFRRYLQMRKGQQLHFELGRAIVAQCGTLVSRVLYVKEATLKKFTIIDAGMTDLIRPALYDAYHRIENITSSEQSQNTYDVVGPICESSDVFVRNYTMPTTRRGDLLAIRSTGAYGEIMASQYNCRTLPASYTSQELCCQE
ncbi:MAG: diaminopimelate decarboxylase [Bacteroidaceae bacterium]|nr:diaminopimelate decarboxylase [Bacteroidaceae bacterium]